MIPLLLCLIPYDSTVTERVSHLQCERFYNEHAEPVFSQFIFWDEHGDIIAWRLAKGDTWPKRTALGWELCWQDGHVKRRVIAKSFCETFSQEDTELKHRSRLPKEQRRELLSR